MMLRDDDVGEMTCDDVIAFDRYLELIPYTGDDLALQSDDDKPTSLPPSNNSAAAAAAAAGGAADDGRQSQCKRWCQTVVHAGYTLLSSHIGLVTLLIVYTLLGAAVLHHTEYWREQEMRQQLDNIRQRLVADIINLTVDHAASANLTQLTSAVESVLLEYSDARQSLRPSSSARPSWSFTGAMYFCGTVYTTVEEVSAVVDAYTKVGTLYAVGYGNVSPVTTAGQVITIIYALLGIPLFLVVLASIGKLLTRAIKYLWKFVRRFYYTGSCRRVRRLIPLSRLRMTLLQRIGYQLRRGTRRVRGAVRRRKHDIEAMQQRRRTQDVCVEYEVDDNFNLPPAVALIIGIVYVLLGALLYTAWEDWSYVEAVYFTFISLSTIGLGDVVPDHPRFFIASSLYLLLGLALVAMIINVFMVALHVTISKATDRMMEVGQRLSDAAAGLVEPGTDDDDDDDAVVVEDVAIERTVQLQQSVVPPQSRAAAHSDNSATPHRRRSV